MWFPSLSSLWKSCSARPNARRKPACTRLAVEVLEDRAVPALFTPATVSGLIADINAANALQGPDTITLTAGATYTLTAVNNRTDGNNGLPVITDASGLTIDGQGATIERSGAAGTPAFRFFEVNFSGSLTLQNLTLQGGLVVGTGQPKVGYTGPAVGGAVLNQGSLSLTGVTLQNNTALGDSGHVGFTGSPGPGGWSYGGASYSNNSLSVTGSLVRNNAAIGGQGSDGGTYYLYGDPLPVKAVIPGGDGGDAFGGGIYVAGGTAEVTSSTVTGNSASGGHGGSHGGHKGDGNGGGLYIAPAASVFLDSFTLDHFKHNTASTSDNDISGVYTVI